MANKAASSKTTKKNNKKSTSKVPHLYRERNPECHKCTGKFVGLYVLFAITTIVFAAMSVFLFFFASDVLNKLESIDPACRNGNCQVVTPDIDTED